MTNRSDGIPLDTADPSANDRWGTAANLPGKSFSKRNLPTKVAENYTDDAGNRILQGDLERQHNIPIELYNGPSWPERAYMDVRGERAGNMPSALTRFEVAPTVPA